MLVVYLDSVVPVEEAPVMQSWSTTNNRAGHSHHLGALYFKGPLLFYGSESKLGGGGQGW